MGIDVQEAIRRSIYTERNAMYFYLLGAEKILDEAARALFLLLASEEREHAAHFYSIYRGDDIPSLDQFLDTVPENASLWLSSLSELIESDFCEQRAMELALERERSLEESLLQIASTIDDPEARDVYESNAQETNNHYLLIESEYARIMGMVHECDMDTYVRE
jgi:rubrerythrin